MIDFILELFTCWMFVFVVYASYMIMHDLYNYHKYRISNTYTINFGLKDNFSMLKDCTNKNTTQAYKNVL